MSLRVGHREQINRQNRPDSKANQCLLDFSVNAIRQAVFDGFQSGTNHDSYPYKSAKSECIAPGSHKRLNRSFVSITVLNAPHLRRRRKT